MARALPLVFLLARLAIAAEAGGAARAPVIEMLAEELDSLAARHDGSATPENLAVARRIQEILGSLAGTAASGGDRSREAWSLLERTMLRRERNVAVEAVLALLSLKGNEPLRMIFGSFAGIDPAVRRTALEAIRASGRSLSGVQGETLAALRVEQEAEAECILIDLVSAFGTLDAARSILAKSPGPPAPALPREVREDSSDGRGALREAVVSALAAQEKPEVVDWLARAAWEEASRAREESKAQGAVKGKDSAEEPKAPRAQDASSARLWTLCAVAGARKMEAARPALEGCLRAGDPAVLGAALDSLKAIGAEPSRRALEELAESREAGPRSTRMAAETMASFDPDAAVKIMLELSDRPSWEARAEAALGLATFPGRDTTFLRVLRLLEDGNREVRASAFKALPSFRRKGAVEAALKLLAPLRAKDPALVERYLEWASGRRLGRDKAAWDAWWRAARSSFEFPREKVAKEPPPQKEARGPKSD